MQDFPDFCQNLLRQATLEKIVNIQIFSQNFVWREILMVNNWFDEKDDEKSDQDASTREH